MPQPEKIGVGDLVTIIIREDKKFSITSKFESEKEWKLEAELKKWFRLDGLNKLLNQNFTGGTPGADFEFSNEYEGEGKVNRKDSLVTRIQARVIDVKPNGNLVLQARGMITFDNEVSVITLTGTVRNKDVTPDNTVLSTQLANKNISIQNTGAIRDGSRRGWIPRLLDAIGPF